jgi:hypothetical protein
MPWHRKRRPVRGPAICEAVHHLTVAELRRMLKIDVVGGQSNSWTMLDHDWAQFAAKFKLPAKTDGCVETRTIIAHLIQHHRELFNQRIRHQRLHGKVPRRDLLRQLRVIARASQRPVYMPVPLHPPVASLLAFRLAIYKNCLSNLGRTIKDISAEVRSLEFVSPEVRRAAWEVHEVGAFRHEDFLVGKKNVDVPVRLLISCCANFWRFDLSREITFWRGDSRKRQHLEGTLAYSEFIEFVHAMLELAGADLPIECLYKRIEDALAQMFEAERCEYGCGFNILQKDLDTPRKSQRRYRLPVPVEVLRAGGIVMPEIILTRRSDDDRASKID